MEERPNTRTRTAKIKVPEKNNVVLQKFFFSVYVMDALYRIFKGLVILFCLLNV